jgi:hypothetical protein
MPKRCDIIIEPPINADCPYSVDEIQGKECLSDSLDIINNNFFVLDEASCELKDEVYKHIKVSTEYVQPLSGTGRVEPLPENSNYRTTFVLNFSGEGVDVTENGVLKTVTIPITGVTGIKAGRNVTIQATGLTNDGDIKGGYLPVPAGGSGQGDVIINAILPDSPRQIRTFFYYGPTPATNPGTKQKVDITNSLPTYGTIQNFINSQLGIPAIDSQDPLFNGGDIYVIYQINGMASYISQNRTSYSFSGGGFSYDWYIKIIGGSAKSGTETFNATGNSNHDYSETDLTNFIVYFLSREKTDSWYVVKRAYTLQNLSQLDTGSTWLNPQTWAQY